MLIERIYRLGPGPLTILMLSGSAWLFLSGSERHRWYIAPIVILAAIAIRWHLLLIKTEQDRPFLYAGYAALNICWLIVIVPVFIAGITGGPP